MYIERGVDPGDFLCAVIDNDLRESFGRADVENCRRMYEIVSWFYMHAPSACWGSKEKHQAWIESRSIEHQVAKSVANKVADDVDKMIDQEYEPINIKHTPFPDTTQL